MLIIDCDYHPSFQQIAFVDGKTGELREERLDHREGAEKFYRPIQSADRSRATVEWHRPGCPGGLGFEANPECSVTKAKR